jgi:hypothetical protein
VADSVVQHPQSLTWYFSVQRSKGTQMLSGLRSKLYNIIMLFINLASEVLSSFAKSESAGSYIFWVSFG